MKKISSKPSSKIITYTGLAIGSAGIMFILLAYALDISMQDEVVGANIGAGVVGLFGYSLLFIGALTLLASAVLYLFNRSRG